MNMTFMELYNIIKRRLGIPYNFFELSYEDFVDIVKNKTFRFISQYIPARKYIPFNADDARLDGVQGVYKIPYDGEIISVIEIYTSNLDLAVGYPMAIMNTDMNSTIQTAADVMQAIPNILSSAAVYKTWEFIPPNQLKIFPATFGFSICVVYAEVKHEDLSTIPATFGHDFIELVLSDVYDTLADVRSKYQQISSPFGDIQLNPDSLRTQAENLRAKVYERLVSLPPNAIVVTTP